MKAYGGVDAYLHSFLTYALDRDEWSTLRPARFTPGIEPRYPLGPRPGLDVFGEEENLLPLPGFEPRTVQPVA